MKKTIIITILVVSLLISIAPPALAQEINPAPGSYSYGSTSEFSPYATLGQGTNGGGGSENLASTGQNVAIGFAGVASLIALAGVSVYFANKARRSRV